VAPQAEHRDWERRCRTNCLRPGSTALIRQSVSCDICGTEKKQTNHWFVAHEQSGELRLSGWSSRNRSRAGSKHLCGQTCLHKLVDEFMARSLSARTPVAAGDPPEEDAQPATDASLTSNAAYAQGESSARLITPIAPGLPRAPVPVPQPAIAVAAPVPAQILAQVPAQVSAPAQIPVQLETVVATLADEPPAYATRTWRAEAWEREREREMRSNERRTDVAARRRSG
jgi:hypothetical protein